MTQENILRIAREAGIYHAFDSEGQWDGLTNHEIVLNNPHPDDVVYSDKRIVEILERFAALVAAAQREKLAHWMRNCGYATGQGKTTEDLLDHLGTQIAQGLEAEVVMEREACADICDQHASIEGIAQRCAAAIRARGSK